MKRVMPMMAGLLLAGHAWAVPPGMLLEFSKSPMGTVIFDGSVHQAVGLVCQDCHNKWLFPKMKKGTVILEMDEIRAGQLCGACHNGTDAFGAEGNCSRCHVAAAK